VGQFKTTHAHTKAQAQVLPFRSPALTWFSARKAHFASMPVLAATAAIVQELQAEFSHLVPDPTIELVGMRSMPEEQVSAFTLRFSEMYARTCMGEGEAVRLLVKAVARAATGAPPARDHLAN